MKNFVFAQFALFLITSLFPIQSFGVMLGLTTEQLTKKSERIIVGDVLETKSQWSQDGKIIFTRATVNVKQIIAGKLENKTIIVEYVGGEVGDMGLKASDVSPLKKGEYVLLFLKFGKSLKDGTTQNTIVGKAQGQYKIGRDGIARKGNYSIIAPKGVIDNHISVEKLINKIKAVRNDSE